MGIAIAMPDPRYGQLAKTLVTFSTALKPGDKVFVEATNIPDAMLGALIDETTAAGAVPIVEKKTEYLRRKLLEVGTDEQAEERIRLLADLEAYRMAKMDAYIGLRGSHNITELAGVPAQRMSMFEKLLFTPVHRDIRVKKTRWVVLRWPTPSMAQQAGMSTEAFEDFYFRVCTADYAAMTRAVQPLKALMNQTDRVRITAPGTDLSFSIKDIPAVECTGNMNIPDGECFTAPVRESVNGTIAFNAATIYRGTPFDNIRLTFKEGRVEEYHSSNDEALGAILDSDDGARYIGEFAIAFHPFIEKPMRDILFDEKIRGSLHFALGECYEEAYNGNKSAIHWDMVLMQEPGGKIYFDDVLIRENGRFVLPELVGLNPENLATAVV
jgi:aminopeptidase